MHSCVIHYLLYCKLQRKDEDNKTARNTCVNAKDAFEKSLFLATKNTTTPPVMPSLHSSVLHTDSDTSDVTACCEITSKCGKESTCVEWKLPLRPAWGHRTWSAAERQQSLKFSRVKSGLGYCRAACTVVSTVWHLCKCSSVAKGQLEPVWCKKKKDVTATGRNLRKSGDKRYIHSLTRKQRNSSLLIQN